MLIFELGLPVVFPPQIDRMTSQVHVGGGMRGHRGFLLKVQSHAGMFSPLAAYPT